MTLSEEELSRFFRIRKTVMEMLSDRGYVVGDFEINMSKNEFLQKYGENKREDFVILKAKRNNDSEQILSTLDKRWFPFLVEDKFRGIS
ncbi:DNA-directed RNA polymerases II and IV subunit 5A [Capsicum annuum]|nr:DNA-directed RNA polymerases II and IV subunit 5A [Capsicum annuum]KAF3619238.1 DNA-directed RNA polymerases II and IV subunit 5A [Capsicum annuum]